MISVIVPYWNAAKWIGRCVDSLKQPGDFEFILVNDKSKDDGEQIAREHADDDERFVFVDNKHKKGASGARNTGIETASGEWITFLDVDDEMLPDAYKTYHAVIREDLNANIHQLNHLRYYPTINKLALKYTNEEGMFDITRLPLMWFGVWNKLFRAEILKDIRYDETLQYGEDGLFILECLAKGEYIHHGRKRETAVQHNFINMQSLSKSKDAKGLLKQVHAYEKFMLRQTDPDVRVAVCKELGRLWDSDVYAKYIGEGK